MPTATEEATAIQELGWKRHFVGPEGVRAGWRLLIFFALLGFMLGATWPLRRLDHLLLHGLPSLIQVVDAGIRFAAVVAAAVLAGTLEKRGLSDFGLPFRRMLGKQFWTGALWGFVMVSVIVGIMAAGHAYSPGTLAQAPLDVVKYGLLWAGAYLVLGLHWEFLYRGYLQFTLTKGLGFWPAAAITCVAYAVMIQAYWGQFGFYLLMGVFLCVALRRTGNVWFGIGWYVGFVWGTSFVYSLPDGPGVYFTGHLLNASVSRDWGPGVTMLVIAAAIVPLVKLYPEVKYAPAPAPAAGQTESEQDNGTLAAESSSTQIGDAPAATAGVHRFRRLFVGDQGLRAGWRLLIFTVLVLLMLSVNRSLEDRIADRLPEPWENIVYFGVEAAILLAAASGMGRFEHRSLADYGLPIRRIFGKQFWTGALWGFAMFSLIVGLLAITHNYVLGTPALSPLQAGKYALLWAIACLVQAFFLEFSFRGYAQFTLTTGMGFWPAAAILCLLDAMTDLGSWGDLGFFALMAFFLVVALRHTGNLWFGIGWSTAYLWCWHFFYSFPDRGARSTGHLLHSRMSFHLLTLVTVIVIYPAIVLLAKIYPEVKYASAARPPAASEAKPEPGESTLATGQLRIPEPLT
jgi:membrane protease YdiL (CAAX protease family)